MSLLHILSRFLLVGLVVCGSMSFTAAQLPVPVLNSAYPPAVKAGGTIEVTLAGTNLDDGERLVFSHPGIKGEAKTSPPSEFQPQATKIPLVFTVSAAADVPPGIYEVRHIGRYGASNPRAFMVGSIDEALEQSGNASREKAQELAGELAVSGRCDPNNFDFYAVPLKAGQRVMFDCFAERIDSKLNASLVLYSPEGKELARALDAEGLDPVLDFTPPADGKYVIGVYDFTFGGGADYFYRLAISGAPYIDFVFPPAGKPGSNDSYTLYGRNLPGGSPAEGIMVGSRKLEKLTVNIPLPGIEAFTNNTAFIALGQPRTASLDAVAWRLETPQGKSNPVTIGSAQGPIHLEKEPNNLPNAAEKITVPVEICGQFYPQRDSDWFEFSAKKGEVYMLELIAHRLGLKCDPAMIVQRVTKIDKGEEQTADIAQIDDAEGRSNRIGQDFDTSSDDPSYKLTVPEDGTYRVGVRDQFGDGRRDPRFLYRLIVRKPEPDFRVTAYPDIPSSAKNDNTVGVDPLVLRKGGTALLRVAVERRDEFNGDIEITAEDLPAGVTTPGAILGGNVSAGALVLTASDSAAAAASPIRIVAKAKIEGQDRVRTVRVGTMLWGTQNKQQEPARFRTVRDVLLFVTDQDPEPVFVQAGEGKPLETALGGKLEIPVKVQRRGEMKDPLKLTAIGLPNEIKPKDLSIANGAGEGKLEIEFGQQNVKPGVYTFCLRTDSKMSYAKNPQAVTAAEAEQKQVQEALNALAEKIKQANIAKDQAIAAAKAEAGKVAELEKQKTAVTAEVAAKQDAEKQAAQEKLTGIEKSLAEAQAAAKTAEEAKANAEKIAKELDDKVKLGGEMKKQVDKKLDDMKKQAAPKDLQVSFVSTPLTVRLHASPIEPQPQPLAAPVKAGEKGTLTVKIERKYGFNEVVQLTLEGPPGVGGWNAAQGKIEAGATEGKIEFTIPKGLAAGDYAPVLKLKGKFGNANFENTASVALKTEAAP